MKQLTQDGIAVMTLSDLVDDFCLAQGNMREALILQQYRHARWSWKELFRDTLWQLSTTVLPVNCKDHSIRLPDNCEKVINISVVDCYGKIHPLGFNTDWNTAKIKCIKNKCSCNSCHGQDTLCAVVDSLKVINETVIINNVSYPKTTYLKYDRCGDVLKQEYMPYWDAESGTVITGINTSLICKVETTENGCIKSTKPNMDLLRACCGAGVFMDQWSAFGYEWGNYNAYRQLIPSVYNYWGEWNYNAADRQIVQIFQPHTRHFNHSDEQEHTFRNNIQQVILQYQTNGESPDAEILVPEYAVQAVQMGMFYMQMYLNPRVSDNQKSSAEIQWTKSKVKVVKYLNPISADLVAKLQTSPRPW